MKYWINCEFDAVAKQEEKPEPFIINRVNKHGEAEWIEVDEKTYNEYYDILLKEAENA